MDKKILMGGGFSYLAPEIENMTFACEHGFFDSLKTEDLYEEGQDLD